MPLHGGLDVSLSSLPEILGVLVHSWIFATAMVDLLLLFLFDQVVAIDHCRTFPASAVSCLQLIGAAVVVNRHCGLVALLGFVSSGVCSCLQLIGAAVIVNSNDCRRR